MFGVENLLTVLLLFVTTIYTYLTYRSIQHNKETLGLMREQWEASERPIIAINIFLEADNPIFYLKISNQGKSVAENLNLSIDKPFYKFGTDKDISSLWLFNNTILAFAPQEEVIIALAQSFVVFGNNDKCPIEFIIEAKYQFGQGKEYNEKHFINLNSYLGVDVPQKAEIRKYKDIKNELGKISGELKKINNSMKNTMEKPLENKEIFEMELPNHKKETAIDNSHSSWWKFWKIK